MVQLLPLRSRDIPVDLLSQPVSASITYSAYSTSYAVLTLCLYLLFFAAALNYVSDQKRYKKMVVFIIVFASIMAFLGIIQKLTNTNSIYWLRPSPGIPFASYVNQHHFASLMVMTSSLVFGLLLGDGTGKDKRLLLGIALALMGLAIIFTGSRGGLLSYIGSMGFVWLVVFFGRRRGSREGDPESDSKLLGRKIGMVGAAVALGAVLLGGVMFLGAESSFIRGIGLSDQADVTTGRAHFWKTALLMIKDHPIMGVGLDAFGAAFPKYDTWNGNFRLEQAHNDYIQILTDAGILGFACAAAFIYFFFRRGFGIFFKTTDRFRRGAVLGALGGCLGIFIHSLFDFPLRTTGNTFFFLMLVVIAVGTLNYPKLYKPQRSTN
jgi:O-antigen ligase